MVPGWAALHAAAGMRTNDATASRLLCKPSPIQAMSCAEIHMKHKLRMSQDQVTQAVVDAITFLRSLGCNDIEFTPEDAGR